MWIWITCIVYLNCYCISLLKARGCYLRNSYSLTNSFLRMVLLLLLLPSSTWLPAWLYSSYRFLPASLMVSLLFLPSVLPRNSVRAELYLFIFTEPLFFPGVRGTLFIFSLIRGTFHIGSLNL